MKQSASGGVLNLYKPVGITSHDLLKRVRSVLGGKCGHTGTLDPFARGMILVCWGKATRISSLFNDLLKSYRACVRFGLETDTYDVQGKITHYSSHHITKHEVVAAAKDMEGTVTQEVPLFSARKYRGKPLYFYARKGKQVPSFKKTVCIKRLEVVSFQEGEFPWAELYVVCSSGTYIRSIAAELGRKVGTYAYLCSLRREKIGCFDWRGSMPVEGVANEREALTLNTIPPGESLYWLEKVDLNDKAAVRFSHGNEVDMALPGEQKGIHVRVYGNSNFLGIGKPGREENSLQPEIVLDG